MLDLSHIPNSQQDIKTFTIGGGVNVAQWKTWIKPRKCQFVYIICIGGGGGGSSGVSTVLNSADVTICGGSASAITRAIFNANQLPDRLYIYPGGCGKGGIATSEANGAANGGAVGVASRIAFEPGTDATKFIMFSGANPAGGTYGVATINGAAAFVTSQAIFATLSQFASTAGSASTGGLIISMVE